MDRNVQDILNSDITKLAKEMFSEFASDAIKDATTFLEKTETDVKRWSEAVASGDMSKEDFESLLKGRQDLAKMELLTKKGIAQIEIDKFRRTLFRIIVDKVL